MKINEKIVLLGASDNPNRTSYIATKFLYNKGFDIFPVAQKKCKIDNLEVHDETEPIEHVSTISVFLNPERQKKYYSYILGLNPKRIIFNPGTENPELIQMAEKLNIQIIRGCTIALLSNGLI